VNRPPSPQLAGTLAVAAAASSWGLWALFVRPAGLPAATSSLLVFATMGVVVLPLALRRAPAAWSRRAWLLVVANGVFDALNVLTYFAALRETSVAIAVMTHYLAPVFIAVLAPWVERERVPGAVPGALVAMAGLLLVLQPQHGVSSADLTGAALGAASAVAYCGNVFVVRRLTPLIGATRTMSYHSFVAALIMVPFAIDAGVTPGGEQVAWVVSGAVVLGAASGVAFIRGLAIIGSSRAAMLTYLEPVVAVIAGAVAWGEHLDAEAVAGMVLVLGSGAWVARPRP
jgi:drug/metabolite transporter (DMT)-like permease